MSLRQQQSEFAKYIGKLLRAIELMGYEVTFGDAWAHDGHIEGSFHYKRLAIDLNLFIDGEYIKDSRGHDKIGALWEKMHPMATWGGRFRDPNHYSWGEALHLKPEVGTDSNSDSSGG